jgi:hypothetical protein
MMLLLLACTTEPVDTGEVPFTSDIVVELSGTPLNECLDGELRLQIAFTVDVPEVVADEEVRIHEKTLETGASEASATGTTFTCSSPPYAGFRVYDEAGGLMACYFGEFVAQEFDQTGCPAEE